MKYLEDMAGAFNDNNIIDANYIFSYKNKTGDVLDVFNNKFELKYNDSVKIIILFVTIKEIKAGFKSVDRNMSHKELQRTIESDEIIILSDHIYTFIADGTKDNFKDVFQFYKYAVKAFKGLI
jgi:hypothetical protein